MADLSVDITKLPDDVKDKLAELELELSEGDITQKGYEKKRARLLTPFIQQQTQAGSGPMRGPRGDGSGSKQHTRYRRTHRRVTHNEKRYHSETAKDRLIMTKHELVNILKQFEVKQIDKKLDFLEEHIKKITNNRTGDIKPLLYTFRSEYKNRWTKSHRKLDVFFKNNTEWLQGVIAFPNYARQSTGQTGRPTKEFDYLSNSSKRRKTRELRQTVSPEKLIFATQMNLRAQGNVAASCILQNISRSPRSAKRIKRKIDRASPQQLSGPEALYVFVEANLSRSQYDIIRQADKDRFPCYKIIQRCKKECYPDSEAFTVSSSSAEVTLQALVNHTAFRLCSFLSDVLLTISNEDRNNLQLISKWGCDGSQQSRYKQNLDEGQDDSNIFISSFMPIRLLMKLNGKEKVIWQNPVPSSPRFCRPIRMRFIHETIDVTKEEISYVKDQINSLQVSEITVTNLSIKVNHVFLFTMVDGKICNAATDTKSTMRCYICGLTSKEFNKLQQKPQDPSTFEFGLSTLHARIRFFEFILHLSYKLPVEKWQIRSKEDQDVIKATKNRIQDEFKKKMGLLVDVPISGFGTTNDGNMARRFFADCELSAEITKFNIDLIKRFAVILEVISSGLNIDVAKLAAYTQDTSRLYVSLYPWLPMTPTVHKILQHGPSIVENALLPIGQLSVEASEARNKHFRDYRLNFSRKCSRQDTNRDVINRLLLTSDPLLSSIRIKKNRKRLVFSQEAMEMLKAEDIDEVFDSEEDDEGDRGASGD